MEPSLRKRAPVPVNARPKVASLYDVQKRRRDAHANGIRFLDGCAGCVVVKTQVRSTAMASLKSV
jgi:hypothetical protein